MARFDRFRMSAVVGGKPDMSAMLTTGFLVIDPEYWREQAESIRVTASSLNDAHAKKRMLKIAEGYEVLRKRTEERRHAGW